jgi:hypothetical protein
MNEHLLFYSIVVGACALFFGTGAILIKVRDRRGSKRYNGTPKKPTPPPPPPPQRLTDAEIISMIDKEIIPDSDHYDPRWVQALMQFREILAKREKPQPLTLEQLLERDGKPVWSEAIHRWCIVRANPTNPYHVEIYDVPDAVLYADRSNFYDYPPKEAQLT